MATNEGRSVEVTHTHTESMCHFVCNYGFQKQSLSKETVLGMLSRPTSEECRICNNESDSLDDRRKTPHYRRGVWCPHKKKGRKMEVSGLQCNIRLYFEAYTTNLSS